MTLEAYQPLINDISSLRKKLLEEKFFEADTKNHITQHLLVSLIFVLSVFSLWIGGVVATSIATLLLSVFYFQSAYLTHDIAHGQVTKDRKSMSRLFSIMSFTQGLSITWWKLKHGTHHAHPNAFRMDGDNLIHVDDDIDTMPFLCWDKKLLQGKDLSKNPILRNWLKVQKFAVWPLLLFLRFAWIKHGLKTGTKKEKFLIVVHHAVIFSVGYIASGQSMGSVAAWWIGANLIAGFVTGSFFLFSHSGMDVYEVKDRGSDVYAQIRSTRNFTNSSIIRWMSGALNLQLEHHLFPSLPRSRLKLVAPMIENLFKENKLSYPMVSVIKAAKCVSDSLSVGRFSA